MFWGAVLSSENSFKLSKDNLSKVLHVSNATLGINPNEGILN